MQPITLVHNAITAKVHGASQEAMLEVQRIVSYRVDGAEHMDAFKRGWNGRSSFFEWDTATFPRGFVTLVQAGLVRAGYKVNLVRKPFPTPLGPERPVVDDFGEDPRYDFQYHTADKLVRHGQIIAQIATGGGKSRTAKICYARIGRPMLFLTTRQILLYQMAAQFVPMIGKDNIGVLGAGYWRSRSANFGMVQTLMQRLDDPATLEFLRQIEFVVLEEAHEASGNGYYEILRRCPNAHYRLALTATPFMKDSEEANMRLMASSGPIAIKVSEELLIERGILARPYFKYIPLKTVPSWSEPAEPKKNKSARTLKLYRTTGWPTCYKIGVVHNEERNQAIVFEARRAASFGLSTMILVQAKIHGAILEQKLKQAGVRCAYIFGEDNQTERQAALNALKRGDIQVLIGSTILDVGVDVPAVGVVILAGGGKAEVALRQRIGRGLRAKKNGPNVAFVIDFDDPLNHHLRGHARARRAIVEATPGFVEGILPAGKDFDYASFGFRRAA